MNPDRWEHYRRLIALIQRGDPIESNSGPPFPGPPTGRPGPAAEPTECPPVGLAEPRPPAAGRSSTDDLDTEDLDTDDLDTDDLDTDDLDQEA